MHYVFRDAFLLIVVIKSGYLSYCGLPVRLQQSGHSSLTSLNKKGVLTAEQRLTGCFLFVFHTILCKFWRLLGVKISGDQQFLTHKLINLAPTLTPWLTSPRSWLNWSFWPVSEWFHALCCCILISRWDKCINEQRNECIVFICTPGTQFKKETSV